MRRLRRILLDTATLVSLLFCAAASASWAHSHARIAWLRVESLDGRSAGLMAERGWFSASATSRRHPGRPPATDCFPPTPRRGWVVASAPLDPPEFSMGAADDLKPRPWWNLAYASGSRGRPSYSDHWSFAIRHWPVVALLGLIPGYRAAGAAARARARQQTGRCPACGYDLRATPDRCPECGAVRAAS